MHPIQLNRGNLPRIMFPVAVPTYDVARVQPGIVHLGLGGFHRAHMARYTHALMELDPDALNHGIIGVGLRSADQLMQDSLAP
jgi:mannitol 2-dehydrogenase